MLSVIEACSGHTQLISFHGLCCTEAASQAEASTGHKIWHVAASRTSEQRVRYGCSAHALEVLCDGHGPMHGGLSHILSSQSAPFPTHSFTPSLVPTCINLSVPGCSDQHHHALTMLFRALLESLVQPSRTRSCSVQHLFPFFTPQPPGL